MWLPFPLRARRAVGGALSRSPTFRRSAGFLKRPWVALAVQSAMVALWHVPQLYDAAACGIGASNDVRAWTPER
jgi:cytochrome c oxidase assembly factor CtaG